MITPYRVWLDDLPLHDLDPAIIITDVTEHAPVMHTACALYAAGDGSRVLRRRRESLSVTVSMMIREYSTQRRKAVMNKLTAWARGSRLTLSDRPGQVLHGAVEEPPALGSALKWTGSVSITFTARATPFWQSTVATSVAAQPSASLWVEGTADHARVDVTLSTIAGQPARAFTVRAGDTFITLEDLALPAGSQVLFTHDDAGLLHVTCAGGSLLAHRTPASSDDLLLTPGQTGSVSITGDAARAVFSVKGVWA